MSPPSLLALATELQILILEHVLLSNDIIDIKTGKTPWLGPRDDSMPLRTKRRVGVLNYHKAWYPDSIYRPQSITDICLVCKHFSAIAPAIYYSENAFHLRHSEIELNTWLSWLHPSNVELISCIGTRVQMPDIAKWKCVEGLVRPCQPRRPTLADHDEDWYSEPIDPFADVRKLVSLRSLTLLIDMSLDYSQSAYQNMEGEIMLRLPQMPHLEHLGVVYCKRYKLVFETTYQYDRTACISLAPRERVRLLEREYGRRLMAPEAG